MNSLVTDMISTHSLHFSITTLFSWWLVIIPLNGQLKPSFEKLLASGDAGATEKVANSQSLDELYSVLMLSLLGQFGDHSSHIREVAITAIRRIPDHAKVLGDQIEELSNQPGTGRARERKFYLLRHIASKEAVEQIGRFLFDERNPEKGLPLNDGSYEVPNSHWAANAMGAALGNKPGLKRQPGAYGPDEVRGWQKWWQSPEAEIYKTSKIETLSNEKTSGAQTKPPNRPEEFSAGKKTSLWLWLAGGLLLLLVAWPLLRLKR